MEGPINAGAEQDDAGALLAHPRMVELLAARRRFFGYAWSVFLGAAVLLFGCAAVAPKVLAVVLVDGLSLGFVLAIAYVLVIFGLTVQYAAHARRWDALIAEIRNGDGVPAEGDGGR